MKIAVVTCYFDPDYVRARTLRAALKLIPGVQVVIVKNHRRGLMRYPEIAWKLWQTRRHARPDTWLLTFRGQEILPLVLLLAGRKPVFFDEFIVPIAYATDENHRRSPAILIKHGLARLSQPFYRRWLRRCRLILADTTAHAELSAKVSRMNLRRYLAVPVGTDEKLFRPAGTSPAPAADQPFRAFYYSSGMQPLHGIGTVLAAAELMQDEPQIEFVIVGGKRPMRRAVREAAARGAFVRWEPWVPFAELPKRMQTAGVCLGGPFGDTPQAHHVVTTKTYQMLACAAPVIIGDSEATAEFFRDRQNALVVPQADAPALARAIRWAHDHPKERRAIGEAGRKLFEKNFSLSAIAERLQRLTQEAS